MSIIIKRIYAQPEPDDGYRVLVDRLWPRGVSKARAQLDLWMKDIAPSPELRTWFGHDPQRFEEFSDRYVEELNANPAVGDLMAICRSHETLTLLYGAKNPRINHAVVLKEYAESTQAHTSLLFATGKTREHQGRPKVDQDVRQSNERCGDEVGCTQQEASPAPHHR